MPRRFSEAPPREAQEAPRPSYEAWARLFREYCPSCAARFDAQGGNENSPCAYHQYDASWTANDLRFQPGLSSVTRSWKRFSCWTQDIKRRFLLNLRATIIGENTLTTNVADEAVLRMLVLRSRAVKTAGVAANVFQTNPAGMTLADIFYAVADFSTFSQVDKNRWTVLRDVLIKSKRVNDNDNAGIAGYRRFAIPLGKNLVYRDDGAANSFLTGSETYVLFVAGWRQGTGPDLTMHLSTQGTIRWKDM